MSTIGELWRLLDPVHRRRLPLLLILSVGMATATLLGIAAILPFFAVLADPQAIHRNSLLILLFSHVPPTSPRMGQIALALLFVAGVVAANAINLVGTVVITRYAHSVGNSFHHRLFATYLNSEYAFHLDNDSAVLSRNVLNEATRTSIGLVQNSLIFVTGCTTMTFIVVPLLYVNPLVATVTILGFSGVYAVIYRVFRGRLLRHGVSDSANFQRRIRIVNESFGAIKELIMLDDRAAFVARFDRSCEEIAQSTVSTVTLSLTPKYVLECLTALGLATVAIYLSGTDDSRSWLAHLTFIGLASYRLLPAMQQIFTAMVKIRFDSPALHNVSDDLRGAIAHEAAKTAHPMEPSWSARPLRDIELRHVTFRYGGRTQDAVHDLSLKIPTGSIVGFIGRNGAGKTTTVDLLLGLLVPQSGEIRVDGILIDAANRRAWRSRVAYVPQHLFMIDGTIAENIALGVPAAGIDRGRMREAACLAGVTEFIDSSSHRYQEVVGEHGIRLSGGQRQRIGIARALYRDASLLVLDEATNALDGFNESALMSTLDSLRGKRTVILIAHRLTTLRACDLLFDFEAGTLVASGSVQQLLLGNFGHHVLEQPPVHRA
jgi:ATP-binding cassette, subfamily B, bacterial PglK